MGTYRCREDSLIIRLMDAISQRLYISSRSRAKDRTMSFNSTINDLCENKQDAPVVLMLDEFQHAKTVSGPFRKETENDHTRLVWANRFWKAFLDWNEISHIKEITRKLKID